MDDPIVATRPAKLTPKEESFVEWYLKTGNATAAMRKAYPNRRCPSRDATWLKVQPHIRSAIQARMADKGCNADRTLLEIVSIAIRSDIAEWEPYLTGAKTIADLKAEGVRTRNVKRVKARTIRRTDQDGNTVEEVIREVEFYDRLDALKTMARAMGLFTKPVAEPDAAERATGDAPPDEKAVIETFFVQMQRCRMALPRGMAHPTLVEERGQDPRLAGLLHDGGDDSSSG